MADVLTQIQDELDNLLLQMLSALNTIKTRAPPIAPEGQPLQLTFDQQAAQTAQAQQAQNSANPNSAQNPHAPADPVPEVKIASQEELAADIKQLSYDLIMKEQQIEVLVKNLPGIGSSEREQHERMRELEAQLQEIEGERGDAVRERDELVKRVERGIVGVGAI